MSDEFPDLPNPTLSALMDNDLMADAAMANAMIVALEAALEATLATFVAPEAATMFKSIMEGSRTSLAVRILTNRGVKFRLG